MILEREVIRDNGVTNVGAGVLGVGVLVGLPLAIVEGTKKRSALREYERKYSETNPPSHFQSNLHKDGVGLAFVF
jgi:hypothetical protein